MLGILYAIGRCVQPAGLAKAGGSDGTDDGIADECAVRKDGILKDGSRIVDAI
jgi:hypothetical protein